jgi:methylmalonyl-CoA mutase
VRVQVVSERGGMDTMYQRGKIQEESMYYEHKKHDGSLPLIGVNTFLPKDHGGEIATEIELIRSTEEEKGQRIQDVRLYGRRATRLLQIVSRGGRHRRRGPAEAVRAAD